MPVLPPYPPLRIRNDTPTEDSSNANHGGDIIAGIAIFTIISVLIGIWVKVTGLRWWRRNRELERLKNKVIADQRAWYKSCRPIDQVPNLSMIEEARNTSPSALEMRGPDAIQLPSGVHMRSDFERQQFIARHPSPSRIRADFERQQRIATHPSSI